MNHFIQHWDNFISEWNQDPVGKFKEDIFFSHYNDHNNEKNKLHPEYLPEPYLGDLNSCSSVIINKNPGSPIEELQKHNTGRYVLQIESDKGYSKFASKFPYIGENNNGSDWWNQRETWINSVNSIRGVEPSKKKPFAIEVCPWHSKYFGSLVFNDKINEYIQEWVIQPAEHANRNSDTGIILTSGRFFTNFFTEVGFKCIEKVNEKSSLANEMIWPVNKNGRKTTGEFSLWESSNGSKYYNYVHGAKYNKAPAKNWLEVQKRILSY